MTEYFIILIDFIIDYDDVVVMCQLLFIF